MLISQQNDLCSDTLGASLSDPLFFGSSRRQEARIPAALEQFLAVDFL
jgi:hypothetical protein